MRRKIVLYISGLALALHVALAASAPAAPPAPAAEPGGGIYGDATLRDWVQPKYPAAAAKARLQGEVVVEFVVGVDGSVSEATVANSSDPAFEEAALAAVHQWRFVPAEEDGKPALCAMTVPVEFRLAQLKQAHVPISPPDPERPVATKLKPARAKSAPDPDYPAELEGRRLPGVVQLEFTVGPDGRAGAPRILWASHAAFVETALRTMEKWEFEPAHQGPLKRTSMMRSPMEFASYGAKRAEILEANQVTMVSEPAPPTPPKPIVLIEPVYPYDRLLAGDSGSATVELEVGDNGRVSGVQLVEATAPEFGAALVAAAEAWGFEPALNGTAPVAVRLRAVHAFAPPPAEDSNGRLAAALRPGGEGVAGPAGLDQRLKPLWRGFPVYPSALRAAKAVGKATIEFIIDRDGRVRLPRVKDATHDEFGWAAATAISQWVFERPRRHGEPADVTVSIPVDFTAPKE